MKLTAMITGICPSQDEALLLYTELQLPGLVSFTEFRLYWTSTEHNNVSATAIDFYPDGDQAWGWAGKTFGSNDIMMLIKPVRYF